MKYVSTRGEAPGLPFDEVLLAGLARDGGLYLPERWPAFSPRDIRALRGLDYAETMVQVVRPFVEDVLNEGEIRTLARESYTGFDHAAVAPMKQLGPDMWLMELFHGPTLAFKDMAMQFLGRAFDLVLKKHGRRVCILGATSGDTGSAAIEACRDREALDVFILHPEGRVSEVQRRQMTTVPSPNVHNIAVKGDFDACQDLVKAAFNDAAFRDEMGLSAVNSINWARVMAQIVYYFWAAVRLGAPDRPVSFAVPTGNFGNVYAGWAARQMGLPVSRLVIGTNRNDVLTRFFASGAMTLQGVTPTISPSMDIQVSSNFERLLFELMDRDGARVARVMRDFRATGTFSVDSDLMDRARETFDALALDDEATRAEIARVHKTTGELLDPHSAIGVAAARAHAHRDGRGERDREAPVVALATAHPAKFPDAVEQATGVRPALPPRLADLLTRKERCTPLPDDLDALKTLVRERCRSGAGVSAGSVS